MGCSAHGAETLGVYLFTTLGPSDAKVSALSPTADRSAVSPLGGSNDPVIAIVIVTYNRPTEIAHAVRHLLLQSRQPDLVVVVDNSLESQHAAASEYGKTTSTEIRWLHRPDNVGPAGGFSIGINECISSGAEVILLSDDDDFPDNPSAIAWTVDALARHHERDQTVVAVGSAGATLGRTGRLRSRFGNGQTYDVDYLAGGFLPAYRVTPEVATAFDPAIWFGFEELGAGLRLKAAGYRLLADDGLRLRLGLERKFQAREERPPAREYYSTRNSSQILREQRGQNAVALFAVFRTLLAGLARFLVHPSRAKLAHLKARMRGAADALIGIAGPAPQSLTWGERLVGALGRTIRIRGMVTQLRSVSALLGGSRDGVWVRTVGGVVRAIPNDPIGWQVLIQGAYEEQIIDTARCRLRGLDHSVVLDIGANIGAFSVGILRHAAKVVSIEASPSLVEWLVETRRMNASTESHWTIVQRALAEHPGPMRRTSCAAGVDGAYLIFGNETLDNIVSQLSLPTVSLIKVDLDGMEVGLFEGATSMIARFRPDIIFSYDHDLWTKHGYTASDLSLLLAQWNYTAFRLSTHRGSSEVAESFSADTAGGVFLAVSNGITRSP
jgi:FkbM family methyltransferase